MTKRRPMTLNLTDADMAILDELAKRKDISRTAVLRQALRLYLMVEARVEKGDKLILEDDGTKERKELMFL